MSKHYDWPRFLVARDGAVFLDEQGYLADPTTEYGKIDNPHAKAFDELPDLPVLIFLGEPGIGKSTLLDDAELVATRVAQRPIRLSLGEYGSEDRLVSDLEKIRLREVIEGGPPVVLMIDSLDEGLLSIPQLGRVLSSSLTPFADVPTVNVCLTCRSAGWLSTLEEQLKVLWGNESVGIDELAPLRRVDVKTALVAESLDPEPFLDEIARIGAGPLASRPVTLRFLLKLCQSGQTLATTRVALYHQGCEHLCAEANPDRRDAQRIGRLAPSQRLTVAARIAAVLMFTNKEAVWTGIDADCDVKRDVTLNQLVAGVCSQTDQPLMSLRTICERPSILGFSPLAVQTDWPSHIKPTQNF